MNWSWLRFLTSILAVSILIAPAFSQDCKDGACGICKASGINSGLTCATGNPCCSFDGFCGSEAAWCNSRCQKDYSFGQTCSHPSTPTTPTTPLPSPPPNNLPPAPAPSTPVKALIPAAVSAATVFSGILGFTLYALASFGFHSKKWRLTTDVVACANLLGREPIALRKLTKIVLRKWDDMFKLRAALDPDTREPLGIWNQAFDNRRTGTLVTAIQQTYVQPQFQNNNNVHQVAQEVRLQVARLRDATAYSTAVADAYSTAVANDILHLVDQDPPTLLEAICCSAGNRQPANNNYLRFQQA